MAYADQQMSGNRITALIVVALIHVVLGYALVTGLAYSGTQALIKKLTTVDIKEEVKKEEPPPPPKKDVVPPPIVVPPPPMNVSVTPPQIQTVASAPPPPPAPIVFAAPAAPPAPAAPRVTPQLAKPKGNPGAWATNDDYPTGALRREEQGTTRFRVTVGADGRVTSCSVTGSSGSTELDNTACSLITRRARFTPATDGEGKPTTGAYANAVRWVVPKE